VMKAHWAAEDVASMAGKPLPFDPSDVDLIHRGLSRRLPLPGLRCCAAVGNTIAR
jgi:hypothetical protein